MKKWWYGPYSVAENLERLSDWKLLCIVLDGVWVKIYEICNKVNYLSLSRQLGSNWIINTISQYNLRLAYWIVFWCGIWNNVFNGFFCRKWWVLQMCSACMTHWRFIMSLNIIGKFICSTCSQHLVPFTSNICAWYNKCV